MKLRPVAGIVLRQLYLLRGSPVRLFPMVTWVAIDIVLWGFITRYLNSVSGSGVNFVPTLLGGVLLWDFCARIMQGVSTAFLEDVWSRNFLNLFSSPLSISEYITGLVITSVLTSCVGLVTMLVLATGVFHLQFFALGLPLAAFLMVLFVFGITLGIFGSGIVLRFGPASEWLLWPLPALLSPVRGGVLSARHIAAVDAGGGACAAARVCIRRNAHPARWPAVPRRPAAARNRGGGARALARGALLRTHLSPCGAHGTARTIQRGRRRVRGSGAHLTRPCSMASALRGWRSCRRGFPESCAARAR